MSKLLLKKSDTLRFSSYLCNEHMFQLTGERALAKKSDTVTPKTVTTMPCEKQQRGTLPQMSEIPRAYWIQMKGPEDIWLKIA
jgi:hypothetical protein